MIHIYDALDDRHIEITFFDSDGLDWGWHNTDTDERSDWTRCTAREALLQAAADFGIPLEVEGEADDDEAIDDDSYYEYNDDMDGDFDSAMASAGWGTDEDYGG